MKILDELNVMLYNFRHKTQDTRHKHWQLYVRNLSQHTVVDALHQSVTLVPNLATHNRQPCHQNRQLQSLPRPTPLRPLLLLQRLLPVKRQLRLGFSLKCCLTLMLWLLLPYATTTQALSATTAQVINGSQPYLTFNNGGTKVTTSDDLLSITISDGSTKITYTPADNTSTVNSPIKLLKENQRFTDIGMSIPPTTDSITLNDLIGAPYNYWRDDDGDGQGTNGITATGNVSVRITDRLNRAVSRSASLDICQAPYKVVLTNTDGSLTTQYGVPNSSSFSSSTATYYISPKDTLKICYARPCLLYGTVSNEINFAGPTTIWNPDKGFLVQSTESSSYYRNFPTTGADNLHFDLLTGGIDAATLIWPTVTQGGITATMTVNPPKDPSFNPDGISSVRVTLTGPVATAAQQSSDSPGSVVTPTLPQTFELVGYDSSHREILKYGFVLKQWFVNRGNSRVNYTNTSSWCTNLGGGYHMPQVKDLTNAKCGVDKVYFPCVNGIDGGTPSSGVNYYQRNIGAGLFTEWGDMTSYTAAGFQNYYYWTRDWMQYSYSDVNQFNVSAYNGNIYENYPFNRDYGVCIYP